MSNCGNNTAPPKPEEVKPGAQDASNPCTDPAATVPQSTEAKGTPEAAKTVEPMLTASQCTEAKGTPEAAKTVEPMLTAPQSTESKGAPEAAKTVDPGAADGNSVKIQGSQPRPVQNVEDDKVVYNVAVGLSPVLGTEQGTTIVPSHPICGLIRAKQIAW
uniref:Protein phosphatase 1 regulatory subunit n=1 Tax=Rhipicephalus zambeziensis TaxID=60191 RepID=A0A224YX36_9ACAR